MKKLVLPLVIVVLLAWIFVGTCNTNINEKAFQAKQDSIQHVVDSLNISLTKKDSIIDDLYKIDADLNYQVLHQKEKIKVVTKWVEVEKGKVDTYTEHELVSSFNQRYPQDTTTNPLPLAQPVLVSAAKDLVELDGTKQQLLIKDSVIALDEERIATKDATISLFKSKESDYKFITAMKDEQIKDYKVQYNLLKLENNKLKVKGKLVKIGSAIVIGGLTFLLVK